MKILSPQQLKAVETQTIKIQDVDLINLMERAATAVLNWLKNHMDVSKNHFTIICGVGNNGGDGLALARLLASENSHVKVYLQKNNNYSLDNLTNQKRLKDAKIPIEFYDSETKFEFQPFSIIIDAIFGYGLNRPIEQEWISIINQINQAENAVVSIDVPSGLFCDQLNSPEDAVVQSEVTLTFQTPKLALFLPENEKYVPQFEILDISLDWASMESQNADFHYFSMDQIPQFHKGRTVFSHKYEFGNVVTIGGSYGKIGAILLTTKSVLRSGAGLVTAYVPKCGCQIIQTSFPEAMVMTDFSEDKIIAFPSVDGFDTIAIGPGIGTDEKTALAFAQFLEENDLTNKKMIIDADGINLLAKNPELVNKLPEKTILTPHNKELERLVGNWNDSFEKIKKTKEFVQKNNLIVVSKGAYTQTYLPNAQIYFNSTGNPGMATAGSGDVLTGIIAGHLGKGFTAEEAALFGVFLHGFCGDEAAAQIGQESLIASDILNFIPTGMKKLFG
ncbi:NAD(P)H-hydrate dehydratase [Moheibacter lacus]|nr:NAD(P)H-hydrate dehydratase [Moheibacter lacus]